MAVTLKLAIGSFTVAPYMWPHLADKITVDWDDPNIDSCQVFLEGADGSRVLLNDNNPGVAVTRPAGGTTEYAGSWDQDYGAGIVTDEGSDDISPDGVSATVMADAHRAFAFQMLADYTAKYLVYVIEPVNAANPVTVKQPVFEYTKSSTRRTTPENAHQVCLVHSEGPGVRFGIWNSGTSGTLTNPPTLYDPTERPNTVDWLVTERLVVRGVAHNDGLTTELTTLRDTFEGQSVGNERNNSYGFWLPNGRAPSIWYLALVSSLAEVPPLALFPTFTRDTDDWTATRLPLTLTTWVWAQGPDYFVSPERPMHLDYSSSRWTSIEAFATGWRRTKHTHIVDNTETGAKIVFDPTDVATVRPWRGHYGVYYLEEALAGPWNTATDWGHYHRVSEVGGDIRHHRSEEGVPFNGFAEATDVLTAGWARIVAAEDIIWGVASDGTDTYWSATYNDGRSYKTLAILLTGGIFPTISKTDDGYVIAAAFKYDSGTSGPGTIIAKRRGPGDASWSSEFTFTDGSSDIAFEAGSFHFIEVGEVLVLVATKSGDSGPTEFYSADLGSSWTEV